MHAIARSSLHHQQSVQRPLHEDDPGTRPDHIALFITNEEYDHVPSWLTDNFIVTDGVYHTGQPSRNKNIWFPDGTYIELFNWYAPPPADDNWAGKQPGLVDWGISSSDPSLWQEHLNALQHRLTSNNGTGDGKLGVRYRPLVPGGSDGVTDQWRTSDRDFFDAEKTPPGMYAPTGRLEVPFAIYYTVSREAPGENKTNHPCDAVGLSAIEVVVPADWREEYEVLFTSVVGMEPDKNQGADGFVYMLEPAGSKGVKCELRVRVAVTAEDEEYLLTRGIGISGLDISVKERNAHGRQQLGQTGTSSRVCLVW